MTIIDNLIPASKYSVEIVEKSNTKFIHFFDKITGELLDFFNHNKTIVSFIDTSCYLENLFKLLDKAVYLGQLSTPDKNITSVLMDNFVKNMVINCHKSDFDFKTEAGHLIRIVHAEMGATYCTENDRRIVAETVMNRWADKENFKVGTKGHKRIANNIIELIEDTSKYQAVKHDEYIDIINTYESVLKKSPYIANKINAAFQTSIRVGYRAFNDKERENYFDKDAVFYSSSLSKENMEIFKDFTPLYIEGSVNIIKISGLNSVKAIWKL